MEQIKIFTIIHKYSLRVMMFLIPLWFLPLTQDILDFQKQFLLVILTTLAIIFWMAKSIRQRELDIGLSWIGALILAVVLTVAMSAFFSVWPYSSIWAFPFNSSDALLPILFFAFLSLLISCTIENKKELLNLLLTFIFSSVIAGIYAVLQLYNIFIIPFSFTKVSSFNTVGSITSLAILAAVLLPLSLALSSFAKKIFKWEIWALTALLLLTILIANSFIVWMVLSFELAVLIIFGLWKFKQIPELNWLPFIQALLVVSLFFLIFRVSLPFSPNLPVEVMPSKGAELMILKNALQEKPIFGSGPGTFMFNYAKYHQQGLNQSIFWNTRFNTGSSEILDWFITKGILGGIAIVALMGIIIMLLVENLLKDRDNHSDWVIKMGLLASMVGITLAKILYFSNFVLNFLFWLLVGAIGVYLISRKKISLVPPAILSIFFSFAFLIVLILGIGIIFLEGQKYIAEVQYLRGSQYLAKGDNQEAINRFLSAISLNPSSDLYWRDLSQVYLSQISQIATDKNSSDDKKRQQVQDFVNSATVSANQAAIINPSNVENWNVKGFIYRNLIGIQGADEVAIESYNKAALLEPASPFSFTELGRVYLAKAQSLTQKDSQSQQDEALNKALDNLNKALALKSDYAPAHYLIALIYIQQGKSDEAVAKIKDAIKSAPNDIGLAFQLGSLYYQRNQFDKAQLELERAKSLNPDYSNARYMLGLVYYKQGQNGKALAEFERVWELNPDNEQLGKIVENLRNGRPPLDSLQSSQPPVQENPSEIKTKPKTKK